MVAENLGDLFEFYLKQTSISLQTTFDGTICLGILQHHRDGPKGKHIPFRQLKQFQLEFLIVLHEIIKEEGLSLSIPHSRRRGHMLSYKVRVRFYERKI
jgi:hypothetical protein